jgi:hypothetical protein
VVSLEFRQEAPWLLCLSFDLTSSGLLPSEVKAKSLLYGSTNVGQSLAIAFVCPGLTWSVETKDYS